MGNQPERTCIGCRGTFTKHELVRLVAGPHGVLVDYREKLPGRGAYVCPRQECIQKALGKGNLQRVLRLSVNAPAPRELTAMLERVISEKIKSLILMSAKAGALAVGHSAVQGSMERGRTHALIFAKDISDGTRKNAELSHAAKLLPSITLFTREELGRMLGRELVAVVGLEDRGFADAVWRESERLKSLINEK